MLSVGTGQETSLPSATRRSGRFVRRLLLALALVVGSAAVQAQNTIYATTNRYTIRGATLAELRESLVETRPWKSSPRRHDAFTGWQVKVHYQVVAVPGGSACGAFSSVTHIAVTLPQWAPDTNAGPAVVEAWNRYLAALTEHETGHIRNAREAAVEIHRRVKLLGPEPDPDTLKSRVDQLVQQVQDEYRRKDAEYDARTRHGAAQGAVLPRGKGDFP